MRKIAIPVSYGKLSGHFGRCEHFALYEEENGVIKQKTIHPSPPHQPGLLPQWLANQGATDIITGGMGVMAQQLFAQNNINVILGAPEMDADQVVKDFVEGRILSSDNTCDSEHHGHGHAEGGEHHHHNH